jgi:hypothetical protein
MTVLLRKIIVLVLLFMLGVSGVTVGDDFCSAACENHTKAASASCCDQMLETEMGAMADHGTSPCQCGFFCSSSQTSTEALAPSTADKDFSVELPILPILVYYDDTQLYLPCSFQNPPDTFPPIYKLHCSYLN